MTIPLPKCWICGEDATTGEHKTKKSDLKSVFGVPTQTQPLYYHDANRRNQLIRSLDAESVVLMVRHVEQSQLRLRRRPRERYWGGPADRRDLVVANLAAPVLQGYG